MKRALALVPALLLVPAIANAQTASAPPAETVIYVQGAPSNAPPSAPATAPTMQYYYEPSAMRPNYARPRPLEIPYTGGQVPRGGTLESRYSGWLTAGGVTLGAMYGISVIYALAACPPGASSGSCASNSAWLYVPIVGPFATAADPNASFGGRNLAIFDGVLQTAATVAIIVSLVTPRQVVVMRPEYSASNTRSRRIEWSVSPGAAGATAGATLSVTHF